MAASFNSQTIKKPSLRAQRGNLSPQWHQNLYKPQTHRNGFPNAMNQLILKAVVRLLLSFVILITTQSQAQDNPQNAWTQNCEAWDDWDKAAPPYRVFANTYYVGTCGISAILVTGEQGHVLIDGGTKTGAKVIADNIRALGFSLTDVKLLLHSHEHFDHVAGIAWLKQQTGARVLASEIARDVLATGVVNKSDPQHGMHEPFPAVESDGRVEEGTPIELGELILNPIATPGHSPGALSWYWESCDAGHCMSIVYADSLSPVSSKVYRFSDHPAYVEAYRAGLAKLNPLDCDILLTPHPSASNMVERLNRGSLKGGMGCDDYAALIDARLEDRLEHEKVEAE